MATVDQVSEYMLLGASCLFRIYHGRYIQFTLKKLVQDTKCSVCGANGKNAKNNAFLFPQLYLKQKYSLIIGLKNISYNINSTHFEISNLTILVTTGNQILYANSFWNVNLSKFFVISHNSHFSTREMWSRKLKLLVLIEYKLHICIMLRLRSCSAIICIFNFLVYLDYCLINNHLTFLISINKMDYNS